MARPWLFLLLVFLPFIAAASADDNAVAFLKEKYDKLPQTGKFAVGATVGYSGSRIAVKTAVGFVKVAGATFIVTEVLNFAGVLDDITKLSDEQVHALQSLKQTVTGRMNQFRQGVRRNLSPQNIQQTIGKEKLAAIGVAGGALAGFLL